MLKEKLLQISIFDGMTDYKITFIKHLPNNIKGL